MGLRPEFRLVANTVDVTAAIKARFECLRLTDEAGLQSDMLEIILADHDPSNPIQIPATGTELELYLGYDGDLRRMGLFVFDEYELCGWPSKMIIRARAAVYEETPKGKQDLQTQKVRSWPNNTKLVDMVAKIAKEHGMEPAVGELLRTLTLPHFDQTEESDISFLLRILKNYDALVKPAGGKLAVLKRGELKTASGADLPVFRLAGIDASDWTYTKSARESAGTVVAYWHSTKHSRRNEISVGSGDPVLRIRHFFPTEAAATEAAQSALDKKKRGQERFIGSLPGDPSLSAESLLVASGFRPDVDGEWLLRRVEHELGAYGYRCSFEAEKPNADEEE
jgi:phage protein D